MKTKPKAKLLARIHPPNRTRGYHARRFKLTGSEYPVFDYQRGWYQVDNKTAEKLSRVRNNPQDPLSRPVFQIVTVAEAKAIEEAEKARKARADGPVPLPAGVADDDDDGWGDDANELAPVQRADFDRSLVDDLPDEASPRARKEAALRQSRFIETEDEEDEDDDELDSVILGSVTNPVNVVDLDEVPALSEDEVLANLEAEQQQRQAMIEQLKAKKAAREEAAKPAPRKTTARAKPKTTSARKKTTAKKPARKATTRKKPAAKPKAKPAAKKPTRRAKTTARS